MFDYGMDLQSAIDAPRAFFDGEQHGGRARHAGTHRRGSHVTRPSGGDAPTPWGGAQAIRIRLAARRADRRFSATQGRLRARILATEGIDLHAAETIEFHPMR